MRAKNVCVDLCCRFLLVLVVITALLCMQKVWPVPFVMIPCYLTIFFWLWMDASFVDCLKSLVWNLFFVSCSGAAVFALLLFGRIDTLPYICVLAIITIASLLMYHPLSRLKNLCLACIFLILGGAILFNAPIFTKFTHKEGYFDFSMLLLFAISTSIATLNADFKQWMRDSCVVAYDICLCVFVPFLYIPQIIAFFKRLASQYLA